MGHKRKTLRVSLVAVALATGLLACAPQPYGVRETTHMFNWDKHSIEDIKYSFEGNTALFSEKSHGTQIEYFAPDGRVYLWYPGNTRVVRGSWKVQKEPKKVAEICFMYPESSYNPVTKQRGGKWECNFHVVLSSDIKAVATGDPFDIETGRVPFPLPKEQLLSLEQVIAMTPEDENLQYLYKRR